MNKKITIYISEYPDGHIGVSEIREGEYIIGSQIIDLLDTLPLPESSDKINKWFHEIKSND